MAGSYSTLQEISQNLTFLQVFKVADSYKEIGDMYFCFLAVDFDLFDAAFNFIVVLPDLLFCFTLGCLRIRRAK